MFTIATTRFNNKTWEENSTWREKQGHQGCIYGVPMRIRDSLLPESLIFILEMNNDKNKIVGIGLIRKRLCYDKYYKIYTDQNYNRFTYKSEYRISRESLSKREEKVIQLFDILLFTGKTHLKRGQGITTVPKTLIKKRENWNIIIAFFRRLFIHHFS